MRRIAPCMLLLAALAARGRADDPRTERWNSYYDMSIRSQWAIDEVSGSRVVTVRGVVKYDCPPAVRWLMLEVIPKDPAGDVVREAITVLAGFKGPDTIQTIADLWEKAYKKNDEARTLTLEIFAKKRGDAAERPIELGLTKEKDPRVIAAACRAVGTGGQMKFKEHLVRHLKSKERAVRGAAALALAELRAEETMPQLFEMFAKEKSKRVRYDCWLALKQLSLKEFECAPDAWRPWWTEQQKEIPEGEPNPWGVSFPRADKDADARPYFFGIPVLGDRIVFIVDCSQNINNPWKVDHKHQRTLKPSERIPGFFSVKTRWDLQRNHIVECLKALPDKTEVAFVFYRHEIDVFPTTGKFLRLNKKARNDIATALEETKRSGTAAMYEAFKAGWGFLKDGNPEVNFKKGCDTIVFCTNGQPSDGELKNKADRLRDEIWRVSNSRHIRVHAVGLHNHAFALLQSMAKDGGGLYVHSQEAGDPAEPQDLDFWPEKKKKFEAERKTKRKRTG